MKVERTKQFAYSFHAAANRNGFVLQDESNIRKYAC
ncbi:hypothetical protein ABIE66_001393 [Peribacillus sp. B2I2]